MAYEITYSIADDTASAAVDLESIDAEIRADATVIADAAELLGCTVTPADDSIVATFDIEPAAGTKTAITAVVAAHAGTATAIETFFESSKISCGSLTLSAGTTWEEVGGTCTNPNFFAGPSLGGVKIQLHGQINTDGATAEIRVCHDDGTTRTALGSITLPDTSGAWAFFEFLSGEPTAGGLALYVAEARQNTTTTAKVRYLTLSLFRV